MEKLSARDDVAKSLARCASMSRKIEDDFQKTTYRHNPKKLKEFSAGQDKLLRLQSRDKAVKERDAFQLYSSARQEDVRAIDAEQRTARRELLKKNPDANFNGGMVR